MRHNGANQEPPEWRTWLIGLLIIVAAGILFGVLAIEVREKENFGWDAPIMLTIHQYSVPWLDTLMMWVSDYSMPPTIVIVVIGA